MKRSSSNIDRITGSVPALGINLYLLPYSLVCDGSVTHWMSVTACALSLRSWRNSLSFGTCGFVAVFTRYRLWTLYWAVIESTPPHPVPLVHFNIILPPTRVSPKRKIGLQFSYQNFSLMFCMPHSYYSPSFVCLKWAFGERPHNWTEVPKLWGVPPGRGCWSSANFLNEGHLF
jgi:hypothetical protein